MSTFRARLCTLHIPVTIPLCSMQHFCQSNKLSTIENVDNVENSVDNSKTRVSFFRALESTENTILRIPSQLGLKTVTEILQNC